MSRIIVKNLPKDIKEEKFRSLFASKGEITDLRLCKTRHGVFRRFGFVGFKTEEQAENAIKFFNNSYINTTKIQVEVASDLGEKSARPWSKYSEGSSAFQKRLAKFEERKKEKESKSSENDTKSDGKNAKKKDRKSKSKEMEEMEENPEFQEFLAAHQSRSKKVLWSNDMSSKAGPKMDARDNQNSSAKTRKSTEVTSEENNNDDNSSGHSENGGSDEECEKTTSASAMDLSDMDYLRSKMVAKSDDKHSESSADGTDSEDEHDDDDDDDSSSSDESDSSDEKISKDTSQSNQNANEMQHSQTPWTLKMRGLPFKLKEEEIRTFFSPIECVEIRFVNNKMGQRSGRAFVDFKSEEDLEKALKRDKDYIKRRYIELFRDYGIDHRQGDKQEEDKKPWMKKLKEKGNDDNEEDEAIGESGRLFLRNLSYTCTEDDIQKLFEKHGLLSEVNLPLDKQTNKTIGIGYVTFLMPEHAVNAFNELDGKVFQGRLLHILPSKAKKAEYEIIDTSYKKKNEAKKKAQSSSDHNWNTLFLGVNAVADAMADKYNTTKRGILDSESSNSLAVRMALGETQVVADTRKFLVDHGVKLDVFGQPTSSRSKTVIIAKNLPYGTRPEELTTLFSPFGQLGRVVLPPSGITALIEFNEASIARKAFQKLAYTKFKNSLLYLEWAPVDVFVEGSETKTSDIEMKDEDKDKQTKQEEELSGEESEDEDSEGKILFVKNLNFKTTEDTLKEKFSRAGAVKSITIAKKKDSKNQGALLSMGYGFVAFKKKSSALKAMKELQNCMVDNHALELKISHRKSNDQVTKRQRNTTSKQKNSKILVRNVPFEATSKEIRELFSTFGEIKTLRLPKKMVGTGPHRGFAFVDFLTKQDAKRAFESLSTSTHLYGRRLVLEWAEDDDDIDTLRKRTAEHFHGEPKKQKKKQAIVDELLGTTDEA